MEVFDDQARYLRHVVKCTHVCVIKLYAKVDWLANLPAI